MSVAWFDGKTGPSESPSKGTRVAFHVACEYPSGERLLDAMVLELDDGGKIVRHLEVQA
jgi:hypothetical protein